MLRKILKSTQGKPCSCPEGKRCDGCTNKKAKPLVYLEEPRRLSIPIVINYGQKRRATSKSKNRTLCQWYKRKRALKKAQQYEKKEKNRLAKLQQEEMKEREHQLHEHFKLQEREAKSAKPELVEKHAVIKMKPDRTENIVVKQSKVKKVKAKTATAKPMSESRAVTVKKRSRYESLGNRFVNWFYRICCQFYCCLTIVVAITFVIIFII